MRQRANDGLNKVYWTIALVLIILGALAAVLWWYDGYWAKLG